MTVIFSPVAQQYEKVIFLTNKHSCYEEELKYIADHYSKYNVFIYQDYFSGDTYNKVLKFAQEFTICSGDNSFINALNYKLFPIIIDKNSKTYQFATMLEYIKTENLSENLPILYKWLDRWYSLELDPQYRIYTIKTDPISNYINAEDNFCKVQEKLNKTRDEYSKAKDEELNKACDEYLKTKHEYYNAIDKLTEARYELRNYSEDLTKELLDQYNNFVTYLDENANLFNNIECTVLGANEPLHYALNNFDIIPEGFLGG